MMRWWNDEISEPCKWWNDEMMKEDDEMMKFRNLVNDEMMKWWNDEMMKPCKMMKWWNSRKRDDLVMLAQIPVPHEVRYKEPVNTVSMIVVVDNPRGDGAPRSTTSEPPKPGGEQPRAEGRGSPSHSPSSPLKPSKPTSALDQAEQLPIQCFLLLFPKPRFFKDLFFSRPNL